MMKNKILPYDKNQTYQIGDYCRIIRANNAFCFPPKKNEETRGYGLIIQIIGSYWQLCGSYCKLYSNNGEFIGWSKNLKDYDIIVPKELNPQCYNLKGEWEYEGIWRNGNDAFGWCWIDEYQLDFIRHPTEKEKQYAEQKYWERIKRNGRAFGWEDVENNQEENSNETD